MKQVTTPMPTPTAQAVANQDSFTNFTVDLIETITHLDIVALLKAIGAWIFFIWAFFSVWVLLDAYKRYKNPIVPFLWFLFILPFNLLGFLGYLFIRPTFTREEEMYIELDRQFLIYEVNKLVTCPACGNVHDIGTKYCASCGTSLMVKCPKCKSEMPISYQHCTNCGAFLNHGIKSSFLDPHTKRSKIISSKSIINHTKTSDKQKQTNRTETTVFESKNAPQAHAQKTLSKKIKPSRGVLQIIKDLVLKGARGIYLLFATIGEYIYKAGVFLFDSIIYALQILIYPFVILWNFFLDILMFPIKIFTSTSKGPKTQVGSKATTSKEIGLKSKKNKSKSKKTSKKSKNKRGKKQKGTSTKSKK